MGIYKRKDSLYYWFRKTVGGKQYRRATDTASKMRAQELYGNWVAEIKGKLEKGEPVVTVKVEPKEQTTFRELAERYVEFTRGRLRSAKDIMYMANDMVLLFQDKPLNEFALVDIERVQNDKLSSGRAIRTANHYPILLKTMFRKALDWELVDESVIKKLSRWKKLKGENKRLRYLADEDEADRLIEACEPSYLRPVVITALNTGMRLKEILKLTWNRVDLKNRLILLDKTKNDDRREIPINNTLYETLSGMIRNIKTDYLFYDPRTLKSLDRIDRSWHTTLNKAKITDFKFHDLRHTFASWLVMKGVDLASVQKLLGHKSILMTMRYAHLAPGHTSKAVRVLDRKARKEHAEEKAKNE